MATTRFDGIDPSVHGSAYVHPSARLLGDVVISDEASVWPMCVLRGDSGRITIGARTNFQDASIAHATLRISLTAVGEEVTG